MWKECCRSYCICAHIEQSKWFVFSQLFSSTIFNFFKFFYSWISNTWLYLITLGSMKRINIPINMCHQYRWYILGNCITKITRNNKYLHKVYRYIYLIITTNNTIDMAVRLKLLLYSQIIDYHFYWAFCLEI